MLFSNICMITKIGVIILNKFKRKLGFIVLVIFLASTMLSLIRVQGAATFQGVVEDTNGNPISGAGIVLVDSFFAILKSVTTNSQGEYSFTVTLTGYSPYFLTASHIYYQTEMKTVYSGGTYNFVLTGSSITYSGYVKDDENNAIENAYVGLHNGQGSLIDGDFTSSNGYYEIIIGSSISSPYLEAEKAGYVSETQSVSTEGGTYNFVLTDASITYEGYVEDDEGNKLENAYVVLHNGQGTLIDDDYTDSNGFYEIIIGGSISTPYLEVEKTGYALEIQSVSSNGGTYNFVLEFLSYALIVADDGYIYKYNALYLYNILTNYYGFTDDKIYLLTPDDGDPLPDESDGFTSKATVLWCCDQIASNSNSNDEVLICFFCHGVETTTWWGKYYTISCDNDVIKRRELDNALDDITCNKMTVILDTCHSGYFIGGGMDNEDNRAILTACLDTQTTLSNAFGAGLLNAIDPNKNVLDPDIYGNYADMNHNGRVSILELFEYAYDYVVLNPLWSMIPQSYYGDEFSPENTYIGDHYY